MLKILPLMKNRRQSSYRKNGCSLKSKYSFKNPDVFVQHNSNLLQTNEITRDVKKTITSEYTMVKMNWNIYIYIS